MKFLIVMVKDDESKVVFSTDEASHAQAVIFQMSRRDKTAKFYIYERVI